MTADSTLSLHGQNSGESPSRISRSARITPRGLTAAFGLELVSEVPNQRSGRDDLRLPELNLGLEKKPPGVLGGIQHVPERRGDLGSVARFEEPGASCHQLPALLRPLAGEQTVVEAARADPR